MFLTELFVAVVKGQMLYLTRFQHCTTCFTQQRIRAKL